MRLSRCRTQGIRSSDCPSDINADRAAFLLGRRPGFVYIRLLSALLYPFRPDQAGSPQPVRLIIGVFSDVIVTAVRGRTFSPGACQANLA